MRATNDKLVERYIVVIARELAKALTGLHAAGILHRDIKGMFSLRQSTPRAQDE
jgi:serine/threonine protein kinase